MNIKKQRGIILFFPSDRSGEIGGSKLVVTCDGDCNLPDTFAASFQTLKEKLEQKETVAYLIEECSLVEDKFDGDQSYVFQGVEYKDFHFVYSFKNQLEEIVEVQFCVEYVDLL